MFVGLKKTMINIHGLEDRSSEYEAAKELSKIAIDAIPDIEDNNQVILEIFPSIQCFGQRYQDIDLLVFFADYRDEKHALISSSGMHVQSFCASIEVKNHSSDSVYFEGAKCIVTYKGQDHDVTNQSEQQKYSVRNYIKKNHRRGSSPYISNLIWLWQVPNSILPKNQNNILSSESTWIDFIDSIALLAGNNSNKKISTFSARNYLNEIVTIFSRKLEPSKIDRKKLEAMTKSILDRTQQKYSEKIGEQLLIYRGRGGTGKTVRLIRTAFQAYDEMGLRVILLTYNKALVADLQRLLALLGVKDAIGNGSIAIKTIHGFMHDWLTGLGVITKTQHDFITNYEEHKKQTIEYIESGTLSTDDIELTRRSLSKSLAWDLVLIDESQDWPDTERDLIYKLYGYEKVIIADGVDQFVRGVERIDWREGIDKSKTQIVPLRKSLRLKSSLCKAVGHFAEEIEFSNWNLQPLPESHGGKVIIITGNALSESFHRKLSATAKKDGNKPIDMLFCVPPSWVITNKHDDERYSKVAKKYREWGLEVWDAVDPEMRGEYPTSLEQHRIVQYESCRGLEGWIVVNFAFDEFFEYKRSNAEISDQAKSDMFFDSDESALEYAKKWIMIPLTRAIDTLVIHITDKESYIGKTLIELQDKYPENIETHHFE